MAGPLYYAVSVLPLMGNKCGAPHFCFGEDFNEVRLRAASDTCGDHAHSPVVLFAGVLPDNLASILAKVPAFCRNEFEARFGGVVHEALRTKMIRAGILTAFHDKGGRRLFSPEEISDVICFIMGVTERGQELLVGREMALE